VFLLALTLGFVFELGKKALSIYSKQIDFFIKILSDNRNEVPGGHFITTYSSLFFNLSDKDITVNVPYSINSTIFNPGHRVSNTRVKEFSRRFSTSTVRFRSSIGEGAIQAAKLKAENSRRAFFRSDFALSRKENDLTLIYNETNRSNAELHLLNSTFRNVPEQEAA